LSERLFGNVNAVELLDLEAALVHAHVGPELEALLADETTLNSLGADYFPWPSESLFGFEQVYQVEAQVSELLQLPAHCRLLKLEFSRHFRHSLNLFPESFNAAVSAEDDVELLLCVEVPSTSVEKLYHYFYENGISVSV